MEAARCDWSRLRQPLHRRRDRSHGSSQASANVSNIAQAFLGVGRHIGDGVFHLDVDEGGIGRESISSFGRLDGRIRLSGICAGPGRSRGDRSKTGSGAAGRSSRVRRSVCFVPTIACRNSPVRGGSSLEFDFPQRLQGALAWLKSGRGQDGQQSVFPSNLQHRAKRLGRRPHQHPVTQSSRQPGRPGAFAGACPSPQRLRWRPRAQSPPFRARRFRRGLGCLRPSALRLLELR
jgi:hypothetical protein